MEILTYIFDTNALTDIIKTQSNMIAHIQAKQADHIFCLPQPVDFEIRRGLLWKQATIQLDFYENQLLPKFNFIDLVDTDWLRTAQLWA